MILSVRLPLQSAPLSIARDVTDVTRRWFLLSAASAWLLASGARYAAARPALPLHALVADLAAAKALGRRYLQQSPQAADRVALDRAALQAELFGACPACASARALRQALDERRAREFLHGEIIMVDGWVLARSEVRLCALLALS
jgi:hypothetical protein